MGLLLFAVCNATKTNIDLSEAQRSELQGNRSRAGNSKWKQVMKSGYFTKIDIRNH